MDLHRRKLWGDRIVWTFVVAATVVILLQWLRRPGDFQAYLLFGWCAFVLLLLVGELRVGRRQPERSKSAVFAGWAKWVGEQHKTASGPVVDFKGAVAGTLEFLPTGVNWQPKRPDDDVKDRKFNWKQIHAWRLRPVVPLIPRASGYLALSMTDGRELVYHVKGLRRWRKALRSAAIEGRATAPAPAAGDAREREAVEKANAAAAALAASEAAATSAAVDVAERERVERESAEAERAEAERAEAERLEAARVEAARVAEQEQAALSERVSAETKAAEAKRLEAEELAAAEARVHAANEATQEAANAVKDAAELAESERAVAELAGAAFAAVATPKPAAPTPDLEDTSPQAVDAATEAGLVVATNDESLVAEEVGLQTNPSAPVKINAETQLEPVIGLECHVELSTSSKVFCGCPTAFGAAPNTQICPVCTGQPGTLPVLNEKAVEFGIRIGLALNCRIAPRSIFHRKNYFYPDMPKNFQISQYDIPLASDGWLEFAVDGETKRCRIHRVHLEEDTGKSSHAGGSGRIAESEYSLVDYNRAGVPLVEIVSEADIRTPAEARAYLAELRAVLESLGVSDVRMDQGSLRCDANVSMRPAGTEPFGTKAEVKNMNSMRSVQAALEFEIERQSGVLRSGDRVVQETRHFNEATSTTSSLRSKEQAFDYRYFPEPDLLPVVPDRAWIERIRSTLPELPAQRRRRFSSQLGLSDIDARTITASAGLADAFEQAVRIYGGEAGNIARWYLGELSAFANEQGTQPHEVGASPEAIADLQRLVDDGTVSISQAKSKVLRGVVAGRGAREVAEELGGQISDTGELDGIVAAVLAENLDVVEKYRAGNESSINFLKGQVMKRTQGRANPAVVTEVLLEQLRS